jgi:hypothetical protein
LFDFLNQIKSCECCIHANASWCFLSAKGFKNVFRCCPNPFENFPDFLGIYSALSYFYLLEGSKILFISSEYFIWISHVSIYLWEFSWNVLDFLSIFHALKHFLVFFWNLFFTENI